MRKKLRNRGRLVAAEGHSRQVLLSVVNGEPPEASSASRDDVPRLWIRADARDPLILLSNFLSLPPPSGQDGALAGRWLDAFAGLVDACRGQCEAACPADRPGAEIVCRIPWDDREPLDWVALAVDQGCGCVVSEDEEGPLELVCPVDKRLVRDESLAYSATVTMLRPDADKVVIVSYADDDHAREVLGEGLAILRSLPEGFLQTGRQVVCNKPRQFVERGLLAQVVAGEPLESSPVHSTQRARLRAARVVWLHNALQKDVCDTLACLPPEAGLILHLLGQGAHQGLQIPDPALGDVLRARDLKKDPLWHRRSVKLLYLSLSGAGGPAGALLGGRDSLLRQLLRDSPRVAATICFRWALPRVAIRAIAEAFYQAYWEGKTRGLDASRSLFEARQEAYTRWRQDGGDQDWHYCAWAAPMLITQDASPPAPSSSATP